MADDKKDFDPGKILKENSSGIVSAEVQRRSQALQSTTPNRDVTSAVSQLSQLSTIGALDTAIGDNFFGINHRQTTGIVPMNKDVYGLTLFTRPEMNLSSANLRNVRQLTPLLSRDSSSIQRIIRNTLDYKLEATGIACPFVDPQQAFIPWLGNNLVSINGWPDILVPNYTSQEGVYKETFGWVDGTVKQFGAYTLTANFRNIVGDPITALFHNWALYMGGVFEGTLVPYFDQLIETRIDYNTRIYRLVLDPTKTRVQKICACGAAYPVNVPIGAAFNYEQNVPLNQSNGEISISFQSFGFIAQDDILVRAFNETVELFNDAMKEGKRERYHKKVPVEYLQLFNCRGYPRIEPNTYELQWWVSNELYAERLSLK